MKLPLFYTDSQLRGLDREFLCELYDRLKSYVNLDEYRKRVMHEIELKTK